MNQRKINIAIDGYSSCGKSTLAKALAKELNYLFIDSGAMYRGITWYAMTHNIISGGTVDIESLKKVLPNIKLRFGDLEKGKEHPLLLNGKNISKEIRSMEVSQWVSQVAAIKEVRQKLVEQQQELGAKGGVIMDGRDIGTVVFPDAELKLFLTASLEVRTKRRFDELISKGDKVSLDDVSKNLQARDYIDSTRAESPLRQAEDAIVINNTDLTPEEQLKVALDYALQLKGVEV